MIRNCKSKAQITHPEAGLTLLEVLVVIAIISLTAAVSFPYLGRSSHHNQKLQPLAASLVAQMNELRSQAILKNQAQSVFYDSEKRIFLTGDGVVISKIPEQITAHLHAAKLPTQRNYKIGIRFFSDGSSSGGQIQFSNGKQSRQVDVDWLTGTIALRSGDNE